MTLTPVDKKQFKTIGHRLNPIVTVGANGLSESLLKELERALEDHELIKVKLALPDREQKRQAIENMCVLVNAELIQAIGNVALIFRRASRLKPKLSNISRSLSNC